MARTKKTPKPKDPRLVRDNPIHAKVTAVLGGSLRPIRFIMPFARKEK